MIVQTMLSYAVAAATFAALATPVAAEGLPVPEGTVILTISGDIENTNVEGAAQFDLAMLQEMEPVEFTTTTIWTEGEQTFTGVSLEALLEAVGNQGEELSAIAFNDYAVAIPVSDAVESGPIVAYLNNGEEMSRRDKGPLWIVYPYDSNIDYRSETTYSRSIWQLDRLTSD